MSFLVVWFLGFFVLFRTGAMPKLFGRECFGFWSGGRQVLSKFLLIPGKFKHVVLQFVLFPCIKTAVSFHILV